MKKYKVQVRRQWVDEVTVVVEATDAINAQVMAEETALQEAEKNHQKADLTQAQYEAVEYKEL